MKWFHPIILILSVSVDTLVAISLALDVSPGYLLGVESFEASRTGQDKLEQEILERLMEQDDLILDDSLKWKIRQLKKFKKDASGGKTERPF